MNIVFWELVLLALLLTWLFIIFIFPIDKIVESIVNKTKKHVFKQKDGEDNIKK